jgi:hypothetical protein
MILLPLISIKSEVVQQQLGIDMNLDNQARTRAVKRKCSKLKLDIFEDEFISIKQMEQYVDARLRVKETPSSQDWVSGSSFNNT